MPNAARSISTLVLCKIADVELILATTCESLKTGVPFLLQDSSTWPFCVMGDCEAGKCKCLPFYNGQACNTFSSTCWVMYCFVNCCRCSSYLRSLYCKCNPLLYGKPVTTGIFWFDDGKHTAYKSPPQDWKDTMHPTGGGTMLHQSGKVQETGGGIHRKTYKKLPGRKNENFSNINQGKSKGLTNVQRGQISKGDQSGQPFNSKISQPGQVLNSKSGQSGLPYSKNKQPGPPFNLKNDQSGQFFNSKDNPLDKSSHGVQNGINPYAFPSAGLKNAELESNKASGISETNDHNMKATDSKDKVENENTEELKEIEKEEKEVSKATSTIKISTRNIKYLILWIVIKLQNDLKFT